MQAQTYLSFFFHVDTNILEMDIFPCSLQTGFSVSHSAVLQDMQCCGNTVLECVHCPCTL